jgi:thiamine-monophosphate kinase
MKTGEDELVKKIATATEFPKANRPSRGGLSLGIGDDAALLRARPGYQIIWTCDWFLEGSHFLRDLHPPDSVGWKCLARAVSDVGAMGGQPKYYLLSLAIPNSHRGAWLDRFLAGLKRAGHRFGCQLAGGDTTRNDKILIDITVIGEVPEKRAVLRSGAKAGDLVFVTGSLGAAELGLRSLKQGSLKRRAGQGHSKTKGWDADFVRKHLYPEPRMALGAWLATKRIPSSMMDLSDGLSSDLPRLCVASGVGARIFIEKLPTLKLSGASPKNTNLIELALNGGDDYELLFTVHPKQACRLPPLWRGVALTRIGEITRAQNLVALGLDGRAEVLPPRGWDPFSKSGQR